jgi:hypothetical protein
LAESRTSIEQVVSLELGRPVLLAIEAGGASSTEQVTIECGSPALILSYVGDGAPRQRSLDVQRIPRKALARTVALSVVELVEAPEPSKPQVAEAAPAPLEVTVPTPPARARTATQASLLGTVRVFPASSDVSLGARLRSRFFPGQRRALLLGVGGERGSASRAPGDVSITAAYAELGIGYDLWRSSRFALALEGLAEAGYVVLKGRPRLVTTTDGEQIRGAWGNVQLSFSPRFRLAARLELAARAGLGLMVLAPSANFDSQRLDVWRGVSASADLGLALSL